MKSYNLVVFLAALLLGVPSVSGQTSPTSEAVAGLAAQMAAWNKQDLEGALGWYWNSDEIAWVSRKGVSFGLADFAKGMRQDFADRSKMGHYDGRVLHTKELTPDLVLLVLNWSITDPNGKRLMGGVSTQLWRRVGPGWKVVFEHAG